MLEKYTRSLGDRLIGPKNQAQFSWAGLIKSNNLYIYVKKMDWAKPNPSLFTNKRGK